MDSLPSSASILLKTRMLEAFISEVLTELKYHASDYEQL